MRQPRLGLLPLYLALYDAAVPEVRGRMDAFAARIVAELEQKGLLVVSSPTCRLQGEFAAAVRRFERARVDVLVTLHLAYSPSLESTPALAATRLPLVVLDTTPSFHYGPDQDPAELMFNHGIHGVQDLCHLLLREGKPFQVEAGHWQRSDVLDRVAAWARAAVLASSLRRARVGRIGEPFAGMGDFAVPSPLLRESLGVETVPCDPEQLRALLPEEDDPAVQAEMAADLEHFEARGLDPGAHRRTVRACLAVRRWMAQERLSAFTFNFLTLDRASGLPTVPFLEASKAMARGQGYAGEGDVLTAALVGALAAAYPTTFTEMFCPDWADNRIFLSHMGEMNLALAAGKPRLLEKPFPWTDAGNPVVAVGRFRPGQAVLVNLAPLPQGAYTLLVAPVRVAEVEGSDRMTELVRGWIRSALPVADFLAAYSRAGGTHHSALVYGAPPEELVRFGTLMGWPVVRLPEGG